MKRILFLVLLTAAVSLAQESRIQHPSKTDTSTTAPRFQLFVNPEVRADTLLLDTYTGKIWRMTKMNEDGVHAWVAEDRLDSEAEEFAWYVNHTPKPNGSSPVPAKLK